jgi:hypothetical protein
MLFLTATATPLNTDFQEETERLPSKFVGVPTQIRMAAVASWIAGSCGGATYNYESVARAEGGDARGLRNTAEFYRLFMVPGMQHCSGGPGPSSFDMLEALDRWADKGIAPEKVIASHLTNGTVDRTRPLCPYPTEAHWTGTGSTDDAANFVCAAAR